MLIDSEVLDDSQYKNLISKDGFSESDDFLNFFKDRYGLPFSGVLIEWYIL